jgi:hypothetical protein
MPEQDKIEVLTQHLKVYANTSYDLIKLQATERTSVIGSGMISGLLVGLAGILFIFFLSTGAGFYLSEVLGNNYSGFGIIGAFYFILFIVLIIGRKKLIEKPMRNVIIRKIFSKS